MTYKPNCKAVSPLTPIRALEVRDVHSETCLIYDGFDCNCIARDIIFCKSCGNQVEVEIREVRRRP